MAFNACTNIYTHRPRQSFAGPRMLALYVNERARNLYSASFETKRLPLITGASPSSEVGIPTLVAAMPSALETAPRRGEAVGNDAAGLLVAGFYMIWLPAGRFLGLRPANAPRMPSSKSSSVTAACVFAASAASSLSVASAGSTSSQA